MDVSLNEAGQVEPVTSNVPAPATSQNVDTSQGYPQNQNMPDNPNQQTGDFPPEPVQESTGEPEPTTVTPEESAAAAERLKQENARQAKLLSALGLDPLSDIGEQLEAGYITEDMVRKHVMGPQRAPTAPEQVSPQVNVPPLQTAEDALATAQTEWNEAKAAYNAEIANGEISIEINTRWHNAEHDLNIAQHAVRDAKLDSVTQNYAANQMERQATDNVNAVLSIAQEDAAYGQMDDVLKNKADMATVAVASIIADREARKYGLNPTTLTNQQYASFGKEAAGELSKLAEFYKEMGRQEVKNNLAPNVNRNINTPPVTMAPNAASTGVQSPNQYAGANVTSHKDLARKYVSESGRV